MVIIRIQGGLGNQMFEYAFSLWHKQKNKAVKLDTTLYSIGSNNTRSDEIHNGFELREIFGIKYEEANQYEIDLLSSYKRGIVQKIRRKLFGYKRTHITNSGLSEKRWFNPSLGSLDNVYFDGYWCSFLYSDEIEDIIRNTFSFKNKLNGDNERISDLIKHTPSVSIHVRRGDYLNLSDRYAILGMDYYKRAIDYMQQRVNDATFFIFSDDIEWCMKQFENINAYYISWNSGKNSYIDMQLMSQCKHNIVANSTFSMWAGWLNSNASKIVIRPEKIYVDQNNEYLDMWPSKWIIIKN